MASYPLPRERFESYDEIPVDVWMQLRAAPVPDGDLVCKASRNFLVNQGLVERDDDGMNALTRAGHSVADTILGPRWC